MTANEAHFMDAALTFHLTFGPIKINEIIRVAN